MSKLGALAGGMRDRQGLDSGLCSWTNQKGKIQFCFTGLGVLGDVLLNNLAAPLISQKLECTQLVTLFEKLPS